MPASPNIIDIAPPLLLRQTRRPILKCLLLLALAIILLFAAAYAYHLVKQYDWLRVQCLVALIVANLGATVCLIGIMHCTDLYLDAQPRRWFIRWPIFHLKQLLLLAQIATTAAALAAAFFLLFGFKIP